MPVIKELHAEPIPGYRLLDMVGRGGFGEVWKCEAPGGLHKAIKFVPGLGASLGDERGPAAEELQSIQYIKSLRHPFLLSMERVEVIDDELVIVMELADRNLQDLLVANQAAGQAGIDREELLGYLREAADVLDLLNLRHGLQHLDIKPANLFLISDHVKVADFGLVQSLADRPSAPTNIGATPLYAAPELFQGSISPNCDQYSLAIVFQELLTGRLPFQGGTPRKLMMQHVTEEPDLTGLSEADRPIILRALNKDPDKRFASCTQLIQALAASGLNLGALEAVRTGPRPRTTSTAHETRTEQALATTPPPKSALSKYLPDLQLRRCLSRGPTLECWEAHSRDGQRWLARLLYGVVGHDPARDKQALTRLQGLRHNLLPSLRVLGGGPGRLILVSELLETSLRDRFQECRGQGHPGIPRQQLLDWLAIVAEALDTLNQKTELQHLGLHPRLLQFKGNKLRVADYGLFPLLWQPANQLECHLQARYAAPELAEGRAGLGCDSYSLAVIFQEMVTGTLPFRARRGSLPPNLEALSAGDRAVLTRALSSDPAQRFATCTELIDALDAATPGNALTIASSADIQVGNSQVQAAVAELLAEAPEVGRKPEPEVWLCTPHGDLYLQGRLNVSLPPEGGHLKFESFRQHWNAQVVRTERHGVVFRVGAPAGFWKRLFGRPPGLLVEITWVHVRPPVVLVPELCIKIQASEVGSQPGALLRQLGPLVLEDLRSRLVGATERRAQERRLWSHPVRTRFVRMDGDSDWVEAQGKDLSMTGMGLYLPRALPGSPVQLDLVREQSNDPLILTGRCVRVHRCGENWFEAGIVFE